MTAARERQCVTCGTQFRGRDRKCYRCTATDRPCIACGRVFHGTKRTCGQCLSTERTCASCGKTFRSTKNTCPSCAPAQRECACGKQYRGTALTCRQCSATERECVSCHQMFLGGWHKVCRSCRVTTRQCETCGRDFRGDQLECFACRTTTRQCITCGQEFNAASYLECGTCSGRTNVINARRRIRRLAAQIDGPLPRSVYLAVLASGPCVYCGAPATSIDHVRPLSRGGQETAGNLVPACQNCNHTKHARLLIHWDPVRAAHGAAHSPAVAAEMARELAQVLRPPDAGL
jgi:HNH endonuclease